jgi:hypothetical protein
MKVCGFCSTTGTPFDGAGAVEALELRTADVDALRVGEALDHHEADVVSVGGVAGLGVAEPDDEVAFHRDSRDRPAGAGAAHFFFLASGSGVAFLPRGFMILAMT